MQKGDIFRKSSITGLKPAIPVKSSLKELKEALLQSIFCETKDLKKAAVLFSGGIDSSLIAKLVSEKVKIKLFTVGTEKSAAVERAKKYAKLMHLDLHIKILSAEEIGKEVAKIEKIIKTDNKLQLSIATPIYFALNEVKDSGFNTVFCGQGADELFFGYDEFRRALESGKNYSYLDDLRWNKLLNLWGDNLKRDFALAKYFHLELKAPYLEKEFIIQALAFDAKQNVKSKEDFLRKRILRKLSVSLGLPKEISLERKKAIQYDSGISKILEKLV
ncbi:MAG: hypothetical protein COT15_01405 [Candidatus Diapherotrites archaeon CG08_land_8_20_14_0_20_34_12]|nr:MAG: hypothetical protein COT15_01405 [Candidatus Diapherotrites archaeon CG08_land_8_20_14_0_20_34_12]